MAWWRRQREQEMAPGPVAAPPPEPTPEEQLIQAVKRLRQAQAEAVKAEDQQLAAVMADDKSKLVRAKAFVAETGIDDSLCRILREVWHYPSWTNRPDGEQHNHLGVTEVSGDNETTDRRKTKTVRFIADGCRYVVRLEEDRGF